MNEYQETVIATRRRKPRFLTEEEIIENELQYRKTTKKMWLCIVGFLLIAGVVISIATNIPTGLFICGTVAFWIWLISV